MVFLSSTSASGMPTRLRDGAGTLVILGLNALLLLDSAGVVLPL
jgi:hypothetical protein